VRPEDAERCCGRNAATSAESGVECDAGKQARDPVDRARDAMFRESDRETPKARSAGGGSDGRGVHTVVHVIVTRGGFMQGAFGLEAGPSAHNLGMVWCSKPDLPKTATWVRWTRNALCPIVRAMREAGPTAASFFARARDSPLSALLAGPSRGGRRGPGATAALRHPSARQEKKDSEAPRHFLLTLCVCRKRRQRLCASVPPPYRQLPPPSAAMRAPSTCTASSRRRRGYVLHEGPKGRTFPVRREEDHAAAGPHAGGSRTRMRPCSPAPPIPEPGRRYGRSVSVASVSIHAYVPASAQSFSLAYLAY
jgi:hypothetical protein